MCTFSTRNPKFAKTKKLELSAEEEHMLANDRPVQYAGSEIHSLNDLKEHISLDPLSSIEANMER